MSHNNLSAALAGGTVFGWGAEGASGSQFNTQNGSRAYNDTVEFTVDGTQLSGDLVVGFIYSETFLAGFSSLDFNVTENGVKVFDKQLTSVTDATNFFTNNAIDVGAIAAQPNQVFDLNFDLVTNSTGSGFDQDFLLGAVQHPTHVPSLLVQNMASFGASSAGTTNTSVVSTQNQPQTLTLASPAH
jgi:hypothetical protein